MEQPDKNKPCVIMGELCTWCGRKGSEIGLCKITTKDFLGGFTIEPRIKAISSINPFYEYECFYCGNVYDNNSVRKRAKTRDHLIPRSTTKRGTQHITVDCCYGCNQLKGKLMPRSFLLAAKNKLKKERINIVFDKLHKMEIYV